MKADDNDGYHVCDNEPFYDYESSQEISASNQQKGETLSLSKINLSHTNEQNFHTDLSSIEPQVYEADESFKLKNEEIDNAFKNLDLL